MRGYTRRELLRIAAVAGAAGAAAGPLGWPRLAIGATTQTYDDGSGDVPGGVTGYPTRVIIVGAGWAGLTLANALRNADIDCILLEGRTRIGGRANTATIDGHPIDLGCSWIHMPYGGNPMAAFAAQAGVARDNADIELDVAVMRAYDGYLDQQIGPTERAAAFAHAENFGDNEASGIASDLGPGASVKAGAEEYLDRHSVSGDLRRHTEFVIRLISEIGDNYYWDRISLDYWANYESPYLGVGEGDFPQGGYTRLVQAMTGDSPIALGFQVDSIEHDAAGVQVNGHPTGQPGSPLTFQGSHVVVTVPLGVLKAQSISFAPQLPAEKLAVIDRIGFGTFEKVAMVFDEPFWSDALHTHMIYISDHADFEFPLTLDLNRISGIPALVAFNAGPFATQIHTMTPQQRLDLALARLAEVMGSPLPQPRAWRTTDWQGDPFTRGAYSTVLTEGSLADLDTLALPVDGRVLFAGEATSSARLGYADGAMSSGIREAKRLLGRSDVELSAEPGTGSPIDLTPSTPAQPGSPAPAAAANRRRRKRKHGKKRHKHHRGRTAPRR